MPLLLILALSAAQPSPEAITLGRKLAEHGTLAALLPLLKAKETEELLHENPDLTTAERTGLIATAEQVFQSQRYQLMQATGDAYAHQLSVSDLRALTKFFLSTVAAKYLAATPSVIATTMTSVGNIDFKGDVRAAFCVKFHRMCEKE